MPARLRRQSAGWDAATSPSSEGLYSWRGRQASPGFGPWRSPSRPRGQWRRERMFAARYSGGTAPDSHRLPEPPPAITVVAENLPRRPVLGKRAGEALLQLAARGLVG